MLVGVRVGKLQGKAWVRERSTSHMPAPCLPASLCLSIWNFNSLLHPCGHTECKKAALWSPLANRATRDNWEQKNGSKESGTEKQLRVSHSCACLCVLWKGLGWLIHPSARRAKIAVKSRAKNISKNTCRFPWPLYVMNVLQTRPIRKKREREKGGGECFFH